MIEKDGHMQRHVDEEKEREREREDLVLHVGGCSKKSSTDDR